MNRDVIVDNEFQSVRYPHLQNEAVISEIEKRIGEEDPREFFAGMLRRSGQG